MLSEFMYFCLLILTLKTAESKQYFFHIMLFYFKKGKKFDSNVKKKKKKKVSEIYQLLTVLKMICKKFFAKQCSKVWQTAIKSRKS